MTIRSFSIAAPTRYSYLIGLVFIFFSCNSNTKKKISNDKEGIITEGRITYQFPSGLSAEKQKRLVEKCRQSVQSNLKLIKESSFTDSITIQFLNTREEMKKYTGMGASGIAMPERKTMYSLCDEQAAPITHELMHMIAMLKWGEPHPSSVWMNEGLAAFSENNCNGFTDQQIYRYLSANKMLVATDSLTRNFYKTPEMIAYHQAGYMVQFLLEKYGVEKFKQLWTRGFASFEQIYGTRFSTVEALYDARAQKDIPVTPAINWETFKKGCL